MTSRHWQNSSSRSKPWCHGSRSSCQNISTPNTVSTYQSKNHIKVPFTHVFLFCRFCWHFRREKPFWSRALDVTATLFMGSTSNFHTWKPCHDWGRVSTSELPEKRLWNPRMNARTTFLQHLSYGDSFETIWWFGFLWWFITLTCTKSCEVSICREDAMKAPAGRTSASTVR